MLHGSWNINENLAKQVYLATSSPVTLAGAGRVWDSRLQGSLHPVPSAGADLLLCPSLAMPVPLFPPQRSHPKLSKLF